MGYMPFLSQAISAIMRLITLYFIIFAYGVNEGWTVVER